MELILSRRHFCFVFLLVTQLNNTSSQYVTYQKPRQVKRTGCDVAAGQVQVEHFFNVVFAEFINSPPSCVCVQMCPELPTYCYPYGCLKTRKEELDQQTRQNRFFQTVPHVHSVKNQKVTGPMTFLVDPQKEFLANFIATKEVADKRQDFLSNYGDKKLPSERWDNIPPLTPPAPIRNRFDSSRRKIPSENDQNDMVTSYSEIHPKSRDLLNKHLKSPKVHIHYNLREQIMAQPTKAVALNQEKVNATKRFEVPRASIKVPLRWEKRTDRRQFFLESPNTADKMSGSMPSLGMSIDHPQFPNRFFKRETGDNKTKIVIEIDENKLLNKTLSLEEFIENLIENSDGRFRQNSTELNLNINVNYFNSTSTNETVSDKHNQSEQPKDKVSKEDTNIVSMNNSNENIESNKYTAVGENFTMNANNTPAKLLKVDNNTFINSYNFMINKLTKYIERQNKQSMDIMKQLWNNQSVNSSTFTDFRNENVTFTTTDATFTRKIEMDEVNNPIVTRDNYQVRAANLFKNMSQLVESLLP